MFFFTNKNRTKLTIFIGLLQMSPLVFSASPGVLMSFGFYGSVPDTKDKCTDARPNPRRCALRYDQTGIRDTPQTEQNGARNFLQN